MKRSAIIMAFLALFCLGATAQTLPEGATLLFYGKLKSSGYGNYLESITIYQLSDDYYLHRERGFAGAMSPVTSKKEKVARLPVLTMPLSEKQFKTIREWVAASQLARHCEACNNEEDTYRQTEECRSARMNPLGNSAWKVIVEWPGVFTGCGIRCYS